MKSLRFSLITLVATLGFVASAHANQVDFTNVGSGLNMGYVAQGQFGTIDYHHPDNAYHRTMGLLAPKSQIVFSYTFSGPLQNFASEVSSAGYGYWHEGDFYSGYAISSRFTDPLSGLSGDSSAGFKNLHVDTPLLFATANFSKGSNTATISIVNESLGLASFVTALSLLFHSNPAISLLIYNVSALAGAPIPAALPMFIALIAGMFGFGRLRRRTVSA